MNRIKELRKKNKLSQKELGKIVHLSQNTISSYEIGTAEPDLYTIKELAKFFNVTIDYLLGSNEEDIILITKKDYQTIIETTYKINQIVKKLINSYNISTKNNSTIKINANINENNK